MMESNFKDGDGILGELATEVWETCRATNDPVPANSVAGRYVLSSIIKSIKSKVASTEQVTASNHEDGNVAWSITDKNINDIQAASIKRLIDRSRHAHFVNLTIRINGQDEHYEADWIKHMKQLGLSVSMETIQAAANEAGLTRLESCCSTSLKYCNTDQWQGNLEGFAKALLRLSQK